MFLKVTRSSLRRAGSLVALCQCITGNEGGGDSEYVWRSLIVIYTLVFIRPTFGVTIYFLSLLLSLMLETPYAFVLHHRHDRISLYGVLNQGLDSDTRCSRIL